MDLMLEGQYPHDSIKYLYDFGILHLLYKFPNNCEGNNINFNELQNYKIINQLKEEYMNH